MSPSSRRIRSRGLGIHARDGGDEFRSKCSIIDNSLTGAVVCMLGRSRAGSARSAGASGNRPHGRQCSPGLRRRAVRLRNGGKDFQGNATNVPIASTDYKVYAAGDPNQNEFQISRTINFTSATPIYPSPGVRFYIPYVSGTYFIVLSTISPSRWLRAGPPSNVLLYTAQIEYRFGQR
jgi:hypothetical protein